MQCTSDSAANLFFFFPCTVQSAVKLVLQQKPQRLSHKTLQCEYPCKGNMVRNPSDENTRVDKTYNTSFCYRSLQMFPVMYESMSSILFTSVGVYRVRVSSECHFQACISATFRRRFIALLSGSEGYCKCLIRKWGPKSSQVWDRLNWRSRGRI